MLVYGLARSGEAAAAALEERGDDVLRGRPVARKRGRSLAARRRGVGRQVAGRAGRAAARRGGATPRDPGVVGARARLAAARAGREPVRRRHGHERQVDDGRAARRDLPCGGKGRRRRREHRHAAFFDRLGRMGRLRGVVIPARGRSRARPGRGGAAQPRAGPPRPARELRRVPRREAADLRAGRRRGRARRLGPRGDRVLRRRSSARGAVDPRPAQPRERGRGHGRSACGRHRRRGDRARRSARSPGSRTAWSRWERPAACGS